MKTDAKRIEAGVIIFQAEELHDSSTRIFQAAGAEADAIVAKIKAVPPARGFDEVLVPGEPELRSAERRRREGIPIPDDTWTVIVATARSFGVAVPSKFNLMEETRE